MRFFAIRELLRSFLTQPSAFAPPPSRKRLGSSHRPHLMIFVGLVGVGLIGQQLAVPVAQSVTTFIARAGSSAMALDDGELSMSALNKELTRRSEDGSSVLEFAPGLGRFADMQRLGPHHTTTPKEVVEYVVQKLREGNMDEAFTFTCIPVTKRGCHKSSTDWTRRMAWENSRVIGGAPRCAVFAAYLFSRSLRRSLFLFSFFARLL